MTTIPTPLTRAPRAIAAALLALGGFAAGTASAECVNKLENGQVLVSDIEANQIFLLDDVSPDADPDDNQQRICVGDDHWANQSPFGVEQVSSPTFFTNDHFGRLWISGAAVVRVDPKPYQCDCPAATYGTQRPLFVYEDIQPFLTGIAVEPDGDVLLATESLDANGGGLAIVHVDPGTGLVDRDHPSFAVADTLSSPSDIIRDPHTNADPGDTLLSQLAVAWAPGQTHPAGAFAVNESGNFESIATYGWIAAPHGIAATGDRFVYLTDAGGPMDPDGAGPEPEVTRPAQVIQIDRTVAVDFDSAEVDYLANQKRVAATLDSLDRPIGIAVLDGDGVNPDTLLVAVSRISEETGRVVRIDFDPADPANPATTTTRVISRGQGFDEPWDVHIVEGINPDPEPLLYVTDWGDGQDELPGVYVIDPTAPEPTPPQPLATGEPFVSPNGAVVDPGDTNRLLVADSGLPGVIEVDATTGAASIVSQGGLIVWPSNLIVDAAGDLIVTDGGRLLRIDSNDVAQVLSPVPGEVNFFVEPRGVAIDSNGYLLVTDSDSHWTSAWEYGRLIRVSPATGRQWCLAESTVPSLSEWTPFDVGYSSIAGPGDLIFDSNGSFVMEQWGQDQLPYWPRDRRTLLRFEPSFGGFLSQWGGWWSGHDPSYGYPENTSDVTSYLGSIAIAANRDILAVYSGTYAGTKITGVLRHDPMARAPIDVFPFSDEEPTLVPNSSGLDMPYGLAVSGKPRPNPAPIDTDDDGIPDLEDNCVDAPNPDQQEGNQGFGLVCDTGCYDTESSCLPCDANGDNVVGMPDFSILVSQLGNDCRSSGTVTACSADCTGDGIVGIADFKALIRALGNSAPALSGPKGPLVDQDPACP